MTTRPEQDQTNGTGGANRVMRGSLFAFFILFGLFVLSAIISKADARFGWELSFLPGEVPKFLLLLAASLFLMLAALIRVVKPSVGNSKGRGPLTTFCVLFNLLTLNIFLGKANIQFDWGLPFLLGDVPEFLLLLVAAVFLMLAALGREKGQSGNS